MENLTFAQKLFFSCTYQNREIKNFIEGMLMRGTRTGRTIALQPAGRDDA